MKDLADVLTAVGTLLWPLTAAAVLIVLWPTVKGIITNRPFTLKIGSFEMSAQEASDKLAEQIADLQRQVGALKAAIPVSADSSGETVAEKADHARISRVLWVDDQPAGNAFEIARLREANVEVTTTTSTSDAVSLIRTSAEAFQALVTDLGRREGLLYKKAAGFDTIRQARGAGFGGAAIVYTSADNVDENKGTATELRASITASPTDLYRTLGIV